MSEQGAGEEGRGRRDLVGKGVRWLESSREGFDKGGRGAEWGGGVEVGGRSIGGG